ncbi:MAG: Asp-tRNA(Asn)/Glu-tRNA(Gln) amidotransferase subunit GatC [Candidatus Kerfeldbacteria bacterium]|nr:Asp-tRNA(Asn)/Glu-tRNA(Gln) amidotransferase subunit GatC [Candidatus Kerfeldbacteria bacterium]
MSLSRDQVIHIAGLARIALTEAEIEKFQKELSSILDYVQQLQSVNTTGVQPTSQVTGLENRRRADIVNAQFTREQMLASAIETAEDHLKVKSIFKGYVS